MFGLVDSLSILVIEVIIKFVLIDYFYFVVDVKIGNVYYVKDFEIYKVNVEKYINS